MNQSIIEWLSCRCKHLWSTMYPDVLGGAASGDREGLVL